MDARALFVRRVSAGSGFHNQVLHSGGGCAARARNLDCAAGHLEEPCFKSGPNDLLSDASSWQTQVILELLHELGGVRAGGKLAAVADAPEGNCGRAEQRVLRTLGRMRALM